MAGRQSAQEVLFEGRCALLARILFPRLTGQMPLALDLGVLQRIGPAAQLAGAGFGHGFQI